MALNWMTTTNKKKLFLLRKNVFLDTIAQILRFPCNIYTFDGL